jgi:osmotically inducible protein OsmC
LKVTVSNPISLFILIIARPVVINSIIKIEKLKAGTTYVRAEVSFLKDNNAFMLGVELHINIPGVTQQQAYEVVHKAHMLCPYSKAIRGNIDVKLFATNNN